MLYHLRLWFVCTLAVVLGVQSEVRLAVAMVTPSQQHPLWSHKKLNAYGKIFWSTTWNASNQIATFRCCPFTVQLYNNYDM